jgi:hypothetical protein
LACGHVCSHRYIHLHRCNGDGAGRGFPCGRSPYGCGGDNGKDNSADAPWGWDDGNDLQRGLRATDPEKLVSIYFGNEGTFALAYTRNGYV